MTAFPRRFPDSLGSCNPAAQQWSHGRSRNSATMVLSPAITDSPLPQWSEADQYGKALDQEPLKDYNINYSKYNPTPGTGRTGVTAVAPNNYPFYSEDEVYMPQMQADGGQLSEWSKQYNPTKEEAEEDRRKAYESGVPHGYVAPGTEHTKGDMIELWVVSEIHDETEYGVKVDPATGNHSGGPFKIKVSTGTRVEQLRTVIRDQGGIIPALQRLSFAGKHMEDSQRTLQHYGVAYWHARFPHWPIKIRKY